MFLFYFLLIFVQYTSNSYGFISDYKPPNKIISAELVCTDRDMQLHLLLEKPLLHSARIFVREQSADPRCVHHYEANDDHNALMFRVPLSTCGMQRVQQHTTRFSFTTSVVVSFHKFFISSHDRTFRISCDYAQSRKPPQQDVTVGVGVDENKESNVDDVFPETVECSYKLRINKNDTMIEAKTVKIGDEIEHLWKCDNLHKDQFIFIHDCIVNPEFNLNQDPLLIDSDGCLVDETGIGSITYSSDGKSATSKHLAYKFADYPNLLFKCSITICRQNSCLLSNGKYFKIPLDCSLKRNQRDTNSINNSTKNSIQLSEVIRVEENPHFQALDSKDSKIENSDKNFICFSSLIQIIMSTSTFGLFCISLIIICCWKKSQITECHCSPNRIY